MSAQPKPLTIATSKSDAWLDEQKRTIGSSIAAAVCGVNPYMSIAQAYDYMAGAAAPVEMNGHIERGILLEPIARRKLAEKLKTQIEPNAEHGFVYSKKYPFAHALPDGFIEHQAQSIPVELKVPTPQNWQMIRLKGVHDYWLMQCYHQLAVTGAPYLQFGALNPVTMQIVDVIVNRDDALIDSIMERESAFWEMLKRGERPADDHVPAEPMVLPETGGEMVTLTGDDALAAAASFIEAQEIRKDAEALEAAAKARILELMAGADVAGLPGLRVYNREQVGKVSFDKKALAKAHPEIDLSQFEKRGNPFRVFKSYRIGG